MSRKYFLFSGITIMLMLGVYDFVYSIQEFAFLHSFDGGITPFIFSLVALGLCIPALVLAIKAFKRKENNLVASVFLIVAAVSYFGYRIVSVASMLGTLLRHNEPIYVSLSWVVYGVEEFLIGLLPVVLAVFSLFDFKKNQQDYDVSSKVSNVFYYIATAIALQSFIIFSSIGARIAFVINSYAGNAVLDCLIYSLSGLAILGLITPSFIMSFFKNKDKFVNRVLLLVASILVTVTYIWSTKNSIDSINSFASPNNNASIFFEVFGNLMTVSVIMVSAILSFKKFKGKEPEITQTNNELE